MLPLPRGMSGVKPTSRSSLATRCCHEEGEDGWELPGSTGQVAEHIPALQRQSWQQREPREKLPRETQKENPKEKLWGVSAPLDCSAEGEQGAWPCAESQAPF